MIHLFFEQSGTFKNEFINCEPKNNFVAESYSIGGGKKIVTKKNQIERSLINKNYAERFIKEFIL